MTVDNDRVTGMAEEQGTPALYGLNIQHRQVGQIKTGEVRQHGRVALGVTVAPVNTDLRLATVQGDRCRL